MATKFVYLFSEGNADMRELLGGKGANLAEMTNIGLPVPQGFTITTEACTQYYEDGELINEEIQSQIMEYIAKQNTNFTFTFTAAQQVNYSGGVVLGDVTDETIRFSVSTDGSTI